MELRFTIIGLSKTTFGTANFVQVVLKHQTPAAQFIAPATQNVAQMVTYVTEDDGRHLHIDESFVCHLDSHHSA